MTTPPTTPMKGSPVSLTIFSSHEDWARGAAREILSRIEDCLSRQRRVSIALSGGSTPAPVFQSLAGGILGWSDEKKRRILWFFVDERCVGPEDPQSNYRMAREALLFPGKVPGETVFRMKGEHPSAEAEALRYERLITDLLGPAIPHPPTIDILLMGIGPDGHTASLFPGTSPEDDHHRLVIAVPKQGDRVARISLTYRMLAWGGERLFLVAGADKKKILQKVLSGEGDLPSQWVLREAGSLGRPTRFLLDGASAPTL
ncbi:MAG: 6-phosphogluconolactonase [Leptospirillia bacterium]